MGILKMTTKHDPAFPSVEPCTDHYGGTGYTTHYGCDKREYFAIKILQSLIAAHPTLPVETNTNMAVHMANLLIESLNKDVK